MLSHAVRKSLLGLLTVAGLSGCGAPGSDEVGNSAEPIIDGTDDRLDLFQVSGPSGVIANADGVAIMALTSSLVAQNGVVDLSSLTLQQGYNACPSERFASQPLLSGGWCTAYLVAPRLVVTAGHCTNFAPAGSDVNQYSIVFGWRMLNASSAPSVAPVSDVYRAQRVSGVCTNGDCTVLELERPVTNHKILQIRRSGAPTVSDSIYMLGHPFTLPLKYNPPTPLFRVVPELEIWNARGVDLGGGNSGSPIFNAVTNLVEGTLAGRSDSGGISDFEPTSAGCSIEHRAVPEDNLFSTGFLTAAYAALVPPHCSGDAGGFLACRSSGCGVCSQALDTNTYDLYFENHPNCVLDTGCSGSLSACSAACPAPTAADSSGTPPSNEALFVIGSSSIGSADAFVRDRLSELGFTTTIKSASATTTADANGKDLILISSSVSPSNVGTKFRAVAVPVIVWESQLYDDMGLTGTSSSDFGTASSQTRLAMAGSGHPLAAGLTGTATVTTSTRTFSWGRPRPAAVIVSRTVSDATRATIFAYGTGAAMSGLTAPARRVGFFMHDTTATAFNPSGVALLRAAVLWARGP